MKLVVDLHTLQQMTPGKLYDLYRSSPAGVIPDGPTDGTILLATATPEDYAIARVIRLYVWRGKTFDAAKGVLYNRFPTLNAIAATVTIGPSLIDRYACIVIDYSLDSIVRGHVRDELRQVAPGLYLGIAYQRFLLTSQPFRQLVHFALTTPNTTTDDDGHD